MHWCLGIPLVKNFFLLQVQMAGRSLHHLGRSGPRLVLSPATWSNLPPTSQVRGLFYNLMIDSREIHCSYSFFHADPRSDLLLRTEKDSCAIQLKLLAPTYVYIHTHAHTHAHIPCCSMQFTHKEFSCLQTYYEVQKDNHLFLAC